MKLDYEVKYYDKDDPTKAVRVGSTMMLIGSLPIILELLLASQAKVRHWK